MKDEKKHFQASESNLTIALLTMSGGLQDAYTYINRGGVLANAQTGNIVRMSQHILDGDAHGFLRFLAPVLAFGTGVFIAEEIHTHVERRAKERTHLTEERRKRLHWRQLVVLVEVVLLLATAFIPHSLDFLANILVSFSCAMQVQTFRKVHGLAYASTMCIGNLRSCFEALHRFRTTRELEFLVKTGEYLFMITIFGIGAALGIVLSRIYDAYGILLSCLLLLASFVTMFPPRTANAAAAGRRRRE